MGSTPSPPFGKSLHFGFFCWDASLNHSDRCCIMELLDHYNTILEGTTCYAGFLLAPAEGFSLWQRLFCPLGKKGLFTLFVLTLCHFWCSVVTSVTFSSNLSNFDQIQKHLKKKSQKISRTNKILIFFKQKNP